MGLPRKESSATITAEGRLDLHAQRTANAQFFVWVERLSRLLSSQVPLLSVQNLSSSRQDAVHLSPPHAQETTFWTMNNSQAVAVAGSCGCRADESASPSKRDPVLLGQLRHLFLSPGWSGGKPQLQQEMIIHTVSQTKWDHLVEVIDQIVRCQLCFYEQWMILGSGKVAQLVRWLLCQQWSLNLWNPC